jgi:hypothetical protein
MYTINHCALCTSSAVVANSAELYPFVQHRMTGIAPISGKSLIPTTVLRCSHCGFAHSAVRFTAEEEQRFYSNYGRLDYLDQRCYYEGEVMRHYFTSTRSSEYGQRLREFDNFLARYFPGDGVVVHRVLDYGGLGMTVPQRWSHCEYMSSDLSGVSGLAAGFSVWDGEPVDLVISQHCLEHVSDPRSVWLAMVQQVRVGGWIYVEVPNESNYGAGHIHEHINGFNVASLEYLASLSTVQVLYCGASTGHWALLARVLAH